MLLEKKAFLVNDNMDFVEVKFGCINVRIGYRIGFAIDQNMRLAAKQAAQIDRAPASFWRDVDIPDLDDCPKASRWPQQSQLTPTCKKWEVKCYPTALVGLFFDGIGEEMDYETAVKLGHAIRRASRRAKAWAGDTAKHSRMMGILTDAEQDYKLGIAT